MVKGPILNRQKSSLCVKLYRIWFAVLWCSGNPLRAREMDVVHNDLTEPQTRSRRSLSKSDYSKNSIKDKENHSLSGYELSDAIVASVKAIQNIDSLLPGGNLVQGQLWQSILLAVAKQIADEKKQSQSKQRSLPKGRCKTLKDYAGFLADNAEEAFMHYVSNDKTYF